MRMHSTWYGVNAFVTRKYMLREEDPMNGSVQLNECGGRDGKDNGNESLHIHVSIPTAVHFLQYSNIY